MGTNYDLHYDICPNCNRKSTLHLGKCSAGWKFLFQAYPHLKSVEDYKKFMQENNCLIVDEYDQLITKEEFWKMVEQHQTEQAHDEMCFNQDGFDFTYNDFC